MKRKFLAFLLIIAVIFSLGAAKKDDELKNMGIFLSNFTELGMYNFDLESGGSDGILHLGDIYDSGGLIRFGVGHNIINNRKLIQKCTLKNCPFGSSTIAKEAVASSVRKYFDLPLNHQKVLGSTPEIDFDGKLYHFNKSDFDSNLIYYADVKEASKNENFITMTGELYELDNPKHRPAIFTAKAKSYKWNNKNTWSILSLSVEWTE